MKNQTEINKEVKSYRTFLLQNKGIYLTDDFISKQKSMDFLTKELKKFISSENQLFISVIEQAKLMYYQEILQAEIEGFRRFEELLIKKSSTKEIDEAAKQYAKNVLGEEQFIKNKDAVKAIITDFKEAGNETDWYPAKQINFFDLGNSLEIMYEQKCVKTPLNDIKPLERVFKIIYSCVDGKWNKSERIYASMINGKYNFKNK
jgi:hypothetical protein